MKHREKLIDLIENGDESTFATWIQQQPLLDQTEIMRELKELALERKVIAPDSERVANFDRVIDNYEDKILDSKLAHAQLQMVEEELATVARRIESYAPQLRAYAIECILTDAPNADEMRELAQKLMEYERQSGTFDEVNWKGIF